jgi:hypothetical protein
MDKKWRWAGYFWPATTALLVVGPIYNFRDEGSVLHLVLRVAWLVLLILSLSEIGRHLYRDLRGRRASGARSGAARPTDGV